MGRQVPLTQLMYLFPPASTKVAPAGPLTMSPDAPLLRSVEPVASKNPPDAIVAQLALFATLPYWPQFTFASHTCDVPSMFMALRPELPTPIQPPKNCAPPLVWNT